MRNFTHTCWGIILGRILEIYNVDRGHPYSFREADLKNLFGNINWKSSDAANGDSSAILQALCLQEICPII